MIYMSKLQKNEMEITMWRERLHHKQQIAEMKKKLVE